MVTVGDAVGCCSGDGALHVRAVCLPSKAQVAPPAPSLEGALVLQARGQRGVKQSTQVRTPGRIKGFFIHFSAKMVIFCAKTSSHSKEI